MNAHQRRVLKRKLQRKWPIGTEVIFVNIFPATIKGPGYNNKIQIFFYTATRPYTDTVLISKLKKV